VTACSIKHCEEGMRYLTATIGAIFVFVAVILISVVANTFLPPTMQRPIAISQGPLSIWGTPALLIGVALAGLASAHSFRATLKRYPLKAGEKSHGEHNSSAEPG
jgi:hypothetical protein